ncbi:hypothetical protein D9758_017348 [Tetrapyrgos nigripes]|uniref:Uncharacterized protein n=1 Tax=Tetrapyrgos nigripes TaxID=182062 RepID=A0A8H5FF04_9AGAR|nr:hypothetical protein D9758_017348 [Tetrapyrgos nigripes]
MTKKPPFPSHIPPILFILSFILSAVLSFAVGVMLIVALWAVMRGETSVEAQDNEVYRKVALSRGEMFGNGYDLGAWARRRWSESESDSVFRPEQNDGGEGEGEVANGHENGDGRPRQGGRAQMSAHRGVRKGEELTDEE